MLPYVKIQTVRCRCFLTTLNFLKSLVPKVGLEPTPPLQGPDFESGASAIPPLRQVMLRVYGRVEVCQPPPTTLRGEDRPGCARGYFALGDSFV